MARSGVGLHYTVAVSQHPPIQGTLSFAYLTFPGDYLLACCGPYNLLVTVSAFTLR
jgi:hypothetical protein